MDVLTFNELSPVEAEKLVRPCLDVQRWIDDVIRGRPYADLDELLDHAERSGEKLSTAEVSQALAHHPRIGERAEGETKEATLSRNEQAGLGIDDDIQAQLEQGNADYEKQFDQVFLIRAAGRSSQEILTELRRRLQNSPEDEMAETAEQLSQIARLRLKGLFS